MQVGNKTYFSPKRYKVNNDNLDDEIIYCKISNMETLYHRNIGPAVITHGYFSWSFNGIDKRKNGPSFIHPTPQGKYWNINSTENSSEEEYWNS